MRPLSIDLMLKITLNKMFPFGIIGIESVGKRVKGNGDRVLPPSEMLNITIMVLESECITYRHQISYFSVLPFRRLFGVWRGCWRTPAIGAACPIVSFGDPFHALVIACC